jgi:hypothetical protein
MGCGYVGPQKSMRISRLGTGDGEVERRGHNVDVGVAASIRTGMRAKRSWLL